MKAGAKAILFQYGNAYYPNDDIDQRDLREVVSGEKKVLCAMIHSRQAVELVKNKVKTIRLEVSQKEYDGESHNVIAGLPGKREEFIVLTAHYDSTSPVSYTHLGKSLCSFQLRRKLCRGGNHRGEKKCQKDPGCPRGHPSFRYHPVADSGERVLKP